MTDKMGLKARRKMIKVKTLNSKVPVLGKIAILNMYASII